MNITNGGSFNKKIAFSGQKREINERGAEKQKFFLPYDYNKYTAVVEIYNVNTDKEGNHHVDEDHKITDIKLNERGESELLDMPNIISGNIRFAYRFKLMDKQTKKETYAFDAGTLVDSRKSGSNDKFNIVFTDRAIVNKPGKRQLIMLDQYYPGLVRKDGKIEADPTLRKKATDSVRTHTNKLGGGFLGVIHKLDELEEQGYTGIVGLPITNNDSSHLYWTHNAFQLAPHLGTMDDYKEMQTELYTHGVNWVSDAALVNEGLQGVHFSNLLKWGKESPYYNWFKVTGLDNGVLTLGIIPKKTENVRFKLVNSPYNLDDKLTPAKYDPKKPTYVQFYDDSLASEKQKTDNNLIENYDNNNPKNSYEITHHNETMHPYSFEIDPTTFKKNIEKVKSKAPKGEVDLQDIKTITSIMKFDKFKIDDKTKSAGFETWDGNTDIAKLNFFWGTQDDEGLKKYPVEDRQKIKEAGENGVLQVKDYAINSGKYWTKLTADTQLAYTANLLKGTFPYGEDYMEKIKNESEGKDKKLPKAAAEVMDENVINNILEGDYKLNRLNVKESRSDLVLKELLDFPLEIMPFEPALTAALSSPYIAKRANTPEQLGVSRLDIFKSGNKGLPEKFRSVQTQADALYSGELSNFALDTLTSLDADLFAGEKVTDLGKYVVPEVMPEIMQYILVKSLDKKAQITFTKEGKIDFSKVNYADISLNSLGINADSPKQEAEKLVEKIKAGISQISQEDKNKLINALNVRYKDADLKAYKVAEAIIDRTESGLGWRIDAAKDVSSIDAVRKGDESFSNAWENVISFWTAFNQTVKSVNPHVYTTAEITDVPDLMGLENGENGRFVDATDAETKFIEESGITTTANYSYFYSLIPQMYARSFETGGVVNVYDGTDKPHDQNKPDEAGQNKLWPLQQKMDQVYGDWNGNPGFIHQSPLDGILHSYTFVGNHDKPRILHMLALDTELFYSDFTNYEHKKTASEVLGKSIESIDFETTSAPAIAMGKRLNQAFDAIPDSTLDNKSKENIKKAIKTMAGGKYDGKDFTADAFGYRPFDIVISDVLKEATKKNGLALDETQKDKLKADVLGVMLKPAIDKYYTIYKTLLTLPGDVTDFGGDKIGATGYESKAKNYAQQNRNTINWEWLNDDKYQYIQELNTTLNSILELRNRPELSALNDGVPVSFKPQAGEKFYPLLRYNDKGSMVLTLYNTTGATLDNTKEMDRKSEEIKKIKLSKTGVAVESKQGLPGGLTVGTRFKNANPEDQSEYKVCLESDGTYVLKRDNKQGEELGFVMRKTDYNALVLYKIN